MADAVFHRLSESRKRLLKSRWDKERVITESAETARTFPNATFATALKKLGLHLHLVRITDGRSVTFRRTEHRREGNHAAKARPPLIRWNPLHQAQQFGVVGGVG